MLGHIDLGALARSFPELRVLSLPNVALDHPGLHHIAQLPLQELSINVARGAPACFDQLARLPLVRLVLREPSDPSARSLSYLQGRPPLRRLELDGRIELEGSHIDAIASLRPEQLGLYELTNLRPELLERLAAFEWLRHLRLQHTSCDPGLLHRVAASRPELMIEVGDQRVTAND